MKTVEETYIGDGVYVSFDGWHIWLRTRRGGQDERIALEPNVYAGLVDYARTVWPDEDGG